MSFIGLPPGNILQNLYLSERINRNYKTKCKFLEIGSGNGHISNILLKKGWVGIGVDLNNSACELNQLKNKKFIDKNLYRVVHGDFFDIDFEDKFDLFISYMVIEHLDESELKQFMSKSLSLLNKDGIMILQVPANMKYWNIEDEIAGHIKRYEVKDIQDLAKKFNLKINHLASLNYPLSNWLFSFSNHIIRKKEKEVLKLNQKEKTIYTGNREVSFKTKFPKIFNLVLNPIVLYPFHLLQKFFKNKFNDALVFYIEFQKINL